MMKQSKVLHDERNKKKNFALQNLHRQRNLKEYNAVPSTE